MWAGQCSSCGVWNSLVEVVVSSKKKGALSAGKQSIKIQKLSEVDVSSKGRTKVGISEFDRTLGGGLVGGQVVLLAGEPGIGKSTLLLQVAGQMVVKSDHPVLYASGEESPVQIKNRATRLGITGERVQIVPETNVDVLLEAITNQYSLVIIDSIQTLSTQDLSGAAGSIGQVRESAFRLTQKAKRAGVPLVIVGQITKGGSIAGPKTLEHIVDTVLYLEGDKFHSFRLLKVNKNRFGDASEVGVFEMGEQGMMGVANPSDRFLSQRQNDASGSVVTVLLEGSRPVLLEIQALTAKTVFGYPRRTASGFSNNRLLLLLAVLEKHAGLDFSNSDVYLNVAAGFKINDPSADLAVCLALASSLTNKVVDSKIAVFGEVGLSGEIRSVSQEGRRVKEAQRMGYSDVITPDKYRNIRSVIGNLK